MGIWCLFVGFCLGSRASMDFAYVLNNKNGVLLVASGDDGTAHHLSPALPSSHFSPPPCTLTHLLKLYTNTLGQTRENSELLWSHLQRRHQIWQVAISCVLRSTTFAYSSNCSQAQAPPPPPPPRPPLPLSEAPRLHLPVQGLRRVAGPKRAFK